MTESQGQAYQALIGLEFHVQLRTRSKIFCGCSTAFGAPPNSQVCPVCLGHPGVLPVLNAQAVDAAIRFGLAVGADIRPRSVFARKNYFYPDLPKGYQISQYELPILLGGALVFRRDGEELTLGLERAHLEEDAGKSFHPEAGREAATFIDLNRTGTPLLEVVTRPELHSPADAHACLVGLRQLVVYLGICDGNMEEGSLRCDANVSVRPRGQESRNPKTEIKNLNSFRHVERALAWEIKRQTRALVAGETPEQATRLWDPGEGRTRVMRIKENAPDYRYFPDPDLPPLVIPMTWIAQARASLPELPRARERRLVEAYGIPLADALILADTPDLADWYETAARAAGDGKAAANWVLTEVLHRAKETPGGLAGLRLSPQSLGRMIRLVAGGTISGKIAKTVFAEMAAAGGDPERIVAERGLLVIEDAVEIQRAVEDVLAAHPGPVADYLGGKEAALTFLMGQLMGRTRGRASPPAARAALLRALEARRTEDGNAS